MMTKEKWREMDEQEQLEYLNNNELRIESKLFLNTQKKVGDITAVNKKYKAWIGIVMITDWCDSQQKARSSAKKVLEVLNGVADDEQAD